MKKPSGFLFLVLFLLVGLLGGLAHSQSVPSPMPVPAEEIEKAKEMAKNMEVYSGSPLGAYYKTAAKMVQAGTPVSSYLMKTGALAFKVETSGSVDNLNRLCAAITQGRTLNVALVQSDVLSLKMMSGALPCGDKLTVLGFLPDPEAIIFVTKESSGIKNVKDLDDQKLKIGCGLGDSGTFATCQKLKEMTKAKFVIVEEDSLVQILQLKSGQLDGIVMVLNPKAASSPLLQAVLFKKEFRFVGIDTGWFGPNLTATVPGTKTVLYEKGEFTWEQDPECKIWCAKQKAELLSVRTAVVISSSAPSGLKTSMTQWLLSLTDNGQQ